MTKRIKRGQFTCKYSFGYIPNFITGDSENIFGTFNYKFLFNVSEINKPKKSGPNLTSLLSKISTSILSF